MNSPLNLPSIANVRVILVILTMLLTACNTLNFPYVPVFWTPVNPFEKETRKNDIQKIPATHKEMHGHSRVIHGTG